MKRVTILGSTGSIGLSALDVVRRDRSQYSITGLAAQSNIDQLYRQIQEFNPPNVAVGDPEACASLKAMGVDSEIHCGESGVEALAATPTDTVLCAIVGAAGLRPILAAIQAGNRVALANKEPMVMAGQLIMEAARTHGVEVLPVDSEHSAIFQCLQGHAVNDVACIHLTASGGPFYGRDRDTLRDVTPEQAVRHPTWDMGAKISIDSATLMNKGLEVMETMWLFDLPFEKISIVIHPQSIVHSLVEFCDGSILAHMGVTDMKFPIQFALHWPERAHKPLGRLDLTSMGPLNFDKPDFDEFPCLRLALEVAKQGGTAPAILNAANEAAVEAFRASQIGFLQIGEVVDEVVNAVESKNEVTLETVLAADEAGRRRAAELIATSEAFCG